MFDFIDRLFAPSTPAVDLEQLASQIQEGRKLAIYDQETGLYAYWYLSLRGEDECSRSQRYETPLAVVIVQVNGDGNEWATHGVVSDWLRLNMRDVDIAGYAGHGRFIALLPSTGPSGAATVVQRLTSNVRQVTVALSSAPEDGTDYPNVYQAAESRLLQARRESA